MDSIVARPLNDQCASVFYEKTSHLKDTEFVEIDRPMLELIGFKNVFIEKRDKNGNVRKDHNHNPKMIDKRTDFNNAIKCLRKTTEFLEGTSVFDVNAHFVVQKAVIINHKAEQKQNGGQNKQRLWVRKDKLKQWIQKLEITGDTRRNITNGLVYFIHMETNLKVFKIGYTTNLKTRLEDLQVANPSLLQVYATINNVSRKKETELHMFFQKKHIRGEWFAITPDMIDLVCKATSNYSIF